MSTLEKAVVQSLKYPLDIVFAHELPDTFTPPDEIVEGMFIAGDGSVIYGDSNSGKTFLIIDIACSLARGVDWMGKKTEAGLVIYLAAENPASVSRRLQAYQKYHNVEVPNFAIVTNPIDLFSSEADTERVIQTVKIIEREYNRPARLIVGDTLARLSAGANENAGQDMGIVIQHFDRIRAETAAHFTLIHHCGKNAAAGSRGWSGVKAAIETEIEITDTAQGRCCEITKQRDLDTKGERIGFKLEPVTLGLTKWQKVATSCVVLPTDAPSKQTGKRMSEIGGAIMEALLTKGESMKKAELVKHISENHGHHTSAIYREIKKLTEAGKLDERMGNLYALRSDSANSAN